MINMLPFQWPSPSHLINRKITKTRSYNMTKHHLVSAAITQLPLILLVFGAGSWGTGVSSSAHGAELTAKSFGLVNTQQIILSVPEGIRARQAIEKEIEERSKTLTEKRNSLEKLGQEWDKQAQLLSPEAKQQKAMEFQTKVAALREEEMKMQQEMREKEAQATRAVLVKIREQVSVIAQKKGLFAVFDSTRSGLMYIAPGYVNITDDVILALSESRSEKGPATQPISP